MLDVDVVVEVLMSDRSAKWWSMREKESPVPVLFSE
jgi:hypothetical protein